MGMTSKKGKAPQGLPRINMLNGESVFNGVDKTTREAATTRKANQYQTKEQRKAARLADRRAKYNAVDHADVTLHSDSKDGATTKGRVKYIGGQPCLIANKSTVVKTKAGFKQICEVNGLIVELGNRDTYSAEDKERLERESAGYIKQTGKTYPDLTTVAHGRIKRPVSSQQQLTFRIKEVN